MKTYNSGRPRVHTSFSSEQIVTALQEYAEFCAKFPADSLVNELQECITDLQEELTSRKKSNDLPTLP